jgi:hypothetical protein
MRIAVTTAVVAAALTGLVVSIAAAASSSPPPPGPTTPYPPVPSNPDKCQVERILVAQAQLSYNAALEHYNRILEAFAKGGANEADVRAARAALDRAALALINARYAEAVCQNNATNPGNPNPDNCVNLNLELNRLLDELAITKDLEAIAKANYEAAKRAFEQGAISPEQLRQAELAYELAKLQTKLIEARIEQARERLRNAGCEETVRPSPSPSPTGTGSPSPSPSVPGTGPSTAPPATVNPSSTVVVPAIQR